MREFLARPNGQLLSEHLNNVADLSAVFSNYKSVSRLIGMLHDFGKATSDFQRYVRDGGQRGSVVHSLQGAFYADDTACGQNDRAGILVKEIAALVCSPVCNKMVYSRPLRGGVD